MLSLKMHTQTPGVDVNFERYRGNTTMASRQTGRNDAFRYKREIFRRSCCPQKWTCRQVDVRCEWYSDNGNTNSTQRCRRRTLNVYKHKRAIHRRSDNVHTRRHRGPRERCSDNATTYILTTHLVYAWSEKRTLTLSMERRQLDYRIMT